MMRDVKTVVKIVGAAVSDHLPVDLAARSLRLDPID